MAGVGRAVSSACRLMIVRLPWTVGHDGLAEYFSQFGQLRRCTVAFNYKTGFSKGFGFVDYTNPESAQSALTKEFHILDGKRVEVVRSESGSRSEIGSTSEHLKISDFLDTGNTSEGDLEEQY